MKNHEDFSEKIVHDLLFFLRSFMEIYHTVLIIYSAVLHPFSRGTLLNLQFMGIFEEPTSPNATVFPRKWGNNRPCALNSPFRRPYFLAGWHWGVPFNSHDEL